MTHFTATLPDLEKISHKTNYVTNFKNYIIDSLYPKPAAFNGGTYLL